MNNINEKIEAQEKITKTLYEELNVLKAKYQEQNDILISLKEYKAAKDKLMSLQNKTQAGD
jgi:hypothetical protein